MGLRLQDFVGDVLMIFLILVDVRGWNFCIDDGVEMLELFIEEVQQLRLLGNLFSLLWIVVILFIKKLVNFLVRLRLDVDEGSILLELW